MPYATLCKAKSARAQTKWNFVDLAKHALKGVERCFSHLYNLELFCACLVVKLTGMQSYWYAVPVEVRDILDSGRIGKLLAFAKVQN